MGAYLSRVHGTRQREGASEASVLSLDATEIFLLLFLLNLALTVDGEGVALDADINILFVDARDFKLQSNVVLAFVDVHGRCEVGSRQCFFWFFGAIGFTEKTIHPVYAVLYGGKLTKRFPTGQ